MSRVRILPAPPGERLHREAPCLRASAVEASLAAVRTIILLGPRGLRLRTDVPETTGERMRGLLGRSPLGPDEALLLERTRSIHSFRMRFAIAAALLDRNGVVRAVARIAPRRLLLPRPRVRHVLELSDRTAIRPGDRLEPAPAARSRSTGPSPDPGSGRTGHPESLYFPPLPPGRGRGPHVGPGPPSSSGLGFRPFKAATRVRIPLGAHNRISSTRP